MRIPFEERFWSKVDKDGPVIREELGPCWLWRLGRDERGYGRIWDRTVKAHYQYAHRISFEIANGPLAPGEDVMHACDNPPCVRPDHLIRGSQQANNADRDQKDRVRHGDRHASAKLTVERVMRARTLYATGAISKRALATMFGVSHSTMDDALNGRTWRRVE